MTYKNEIDGFVSLIDSDGERLIMAHWDEVDRVASYRDINLDRLTLDESHDETVECLKMIWETQES